MGKTFRELTLDGFISHLVNSFQAALYCQIHPSWLPDMPFEQFIT